MKIDILHSHRAMASTGRSAQRRSVAPAQLTTQPKNTLSVEDWEAKAPLSDLETRSINLIKAASEKVPLPAKVAYLSEFLHYITANVFQFSSDNAGPSRPSTPSQAQRSKLLPGSQSPRPGTPLSGSTRPTAALATHALHPKQPVQTPQQFYDWFALIDRSVAHSQEAHFRAHVANVSEHLGNCDQLVERIDEINTEVDRMLEEWRSVEEGGKSLKDACEKLLEERVRFSSTFWAFCDDTQLLGTIGSVVGDDGRYRCTIGIFPRARACNAYA
jgi:hypothetical protein